MQKFDTVRRRGTSRKRKPPARLTGWVQLTFWFLSREEEGLYLLAAELKQNGFRLRMERRRPRSTLSCMASGWIHVEETEVNRLCLEMLALADRHRVIMDRWSQTARRFCL